MCFRLIKYILYIKIALHLLIYIFYFICNIYSKYIVGSRFLGQAQYAWDLKPVSLIQWICREWAKELGFRVWTVVVTAFFTLRWDRLGSSERTDPRPSLGSPFFLGLWCVGGSLPPNFFVSLYSLFIVIFFLLNGIPRVGICLISPSFQLLGVVVRTEKYGRVRHKALNAIMTAFPLDTFVVLFCFNTFSTPWGDRECHY